MIPRVILRLAVVAWLVPLAAGDEPPVALRAGVSTEAVSGDEQIAGALNPFVLTDLVSERLLLEVDWVEGYRPSPVALDAAEEALREQCVPGRRIEIRQDDEIPRASWEDHSGREGLEQLTADFLDGDPSDWQHTELVYVLYAPHARSWYGANVSGMTDQVTFVKDGRVASVRMVLLFTDRVRRNASLWVTRAKVERATLVHELGHVLGLVADAGHMQAEHPGHCRSTRCVMHRPGLRAAFANGLPAVFAGRVRFRFGRRCVGDIESAKRFWEARASASPGFVRKLKAERLFRDNRHAEAWRALRVTP